MASITIQDLPRSDALDRQAMSSVAGGARGTGARTVVAIERAVAAPPGERIVDFPPGFGRRPPDTNGPRGKR